MGWSPLPKTASECQSGECKFPLMREATTMKATTIASIWQNISSNYMGWINMAKRSSSDS